MNKDKPLIVTNDDGLSAPDSKLDCCNGRDWEVIVVAPDKPQNGMGNL
jgi:broad specificity polyphosphatase/5'/3'-nucleotidase SurE